LAFVVQVQMLVFTLSSIAFALFWSWPHTPTLQVSAPHVTDVVVRVLSALQIVVALAGTAQVFPVGLLLPLILTELKVPLKEAV
jgi:hypothetical protein